ncbi:hypothetical protein AO381_0294 [Moraxella catarrhalis]|nr:hypothetical protein AO381_0294 [Moraxella catarrhalis]
MLNYWGGGRTWFILYHLHDVNCLAYPSKSTQYRVNLVNFANKIGVFLS